MERERQQGEQLDRRRACQRADAVLRLVQGGDPETVSSELSASVREVEGWRRAFLEGGTALAGAASDAFGHEKEGDRSAGEPGAAAEGRRELADLLPVTVFEIRTDGLITFANQAGLHTFGYSQTDLENGVTAFQVLAPTEREKARRNVRRILGGERIPPQEYLALRKDGSTFPAIIHSSPVVREGRAVGLRGVILDVTEEKQAEERLRDSERRYRHLFENLNDAAFVADAESGIIIDANRRAETLLGRRRAEIIGMHQSELHPREQAEERRRLFAERVRQGRAGDLEAEIMGRDGAVVPVSVSAAGLVIGGKPVVLGILRDITEIKKAEESLERARDEYLAITNLTGDIIIRVDRDGTWTFVNDAACAFWGKSREELIGTPFADYVHPDDLEGTRAAIDAVKRRGTARGLVNAQRTPRGWRVVEWNSAPILNEDGRYIGFQATGRDVTERRRAEAVIRRRAHYDALTELPNRVLFEDRLTAALEDARRDGDMVAILFLDLDRLKMVNDTFGHAKGDEVLREAAFRLRATLRPGDTIARLGGDEFAALLGGIRSPKDAAGVGWRILEALRAPFDIDGHEVYVTVSGGISLYPADGEDAQDLLIRADSAMYAAKERGRNRLQFHTSGMDRDARRRLALEDDLRRALRRQEFFLRYQPQVEIDTGRMIAVEGLLRWRHPERGILVPSDFMDVAKDSGLIDPIGEWVLTEACARASAWEREQVGGRAFRVAVNLSAREFHREGLAGMVGSCLAEAGLSPELLELEISESAVTRNVERSVTIMRELKAQGVGLALDDFGLGHSSLIDLKRLPADVLKIAQPFIRNVTSDENSRAIVEAVIAMAHALGLSIVAEGVETAEQLAFVRARKCHAAQGRLYRAPCSAEAITELLAAAHSWGALSSQP